MKFRDMMTANPAYCLADDSVVQAARIMLDKKVGIVPVVESPSRRRLLGVVTDRDLCVTIVTTDRQPSAVNVRECMSMADLWQRSDVSPQTTHQTLKKVTEPTAHASKPRAKTSKAA